MFIVAVLSALACAFAANPDPSDKSTFHDTGSLLWRNCGGHDAWLRMTNLDMTPSPLNIPGDATFTLHIHNGNTAITDQSVLNIIIKKRLVGRWVTIPCQDDVGTCRYADICYFTRWWFPDGRCPQVFIDYSLPCTCPFVIPAHKRLTLNNHPLHLTPLEQTHIWLNTGEFYLKMVLFERSTGTERMCLEFYFNVLSEPRV